MTPEKQKPGPKPAAYGRTKAVKVPLGCMDAVRAVIEAFKATFR